MEIVEIAVTDLTGTGSLVGSNGAGSITTNLKLGNSDGISNTTGPQNTAIGVNALLFNNTTIPLLMAEAQADAMRG